MMRAVLLLLFFYATSVFSQSGNRIESEYKLGMPDKVASPLWSHLQSEEFLSGLTEGGNLQTEVSVEEFVDIYFDDKSHNLYKQEIGLRHRSRYVRDTLIKQLVQLKTPLAADGVARTEIKYEVKKSIDKNDFYARHSLFKYIKKRDRQDLRFQLGRFQLSADELRPELSLKQTRKRIYIKDTLGALATFTLDDVTSRSFPFHRYTEMEMELNEVRYTEASVEGKAEMEAFNEKLRNEILTAFPALYQDQTPKYNKLKDMIDASLVSKVYTYRMWLILIILAIFAVYLWVTRL